MRPVRGLIRIVRQTDKKFTHHKAIIFGLKPNA